MAFKAFFLYVVGMSGGGEGMSGGGEGMSGGGA